MLPRHSLCVIVYLLCATQQPKCPFWETVDCLKAMYTTRTDLEGMKTRVYTTQAGLQRLNGLLKPTEKTIYTM